MITQVILCIGQFTAYCSVSSVQTAGKMHAFQGNQNPFQINKNPFQGKTSPSQANRLFPMQPKPIPRDPKSTNPFQGKQSPFQPILKLYDFSSQSSPEVQQNIVGRDPENNLVTFVETRAAAAVPFLLKGVSRC